MTKKQYQIYDDIMDYYIDNVKFYKNKSDFTADCWINFEDKEKPFLEIDVQEKQMSKNPEFAPYTNGTGNGIPDKSFSDIKISNSSAYTNKPTDLKEEGDSKDKEKMSIMILLFDAVSRREFFRSFPKTVEFMEKFYDPNQNKKLPTRGF